ncbi:MAG: hypothetical protein OEQ39_04235 [Gammaproteobacteria bacterium]|nr:hypothetical protein [Gammaproteobacteria bacterium]
MSTSTRKQRRKQVNEWEKYPLLDHLQGKQREDMERRRRMRHVRYWCFRLQTAVTGSRPLEGPEKQPGFIEFWLEQKPIYAIDPKGEKIPVPKEKKLTIEDLGGYAEFARIWDVDEDLEVYIRHASVWHEWNLTLMRVVPYLGDV